MQPVWKTDCLIVEKSDVSIRTVGGYGEKVELPMFWDKLKSLNDSSHYLKNDIHHSWDILIISWWLITRFWLADNVSVFFVFVSDCRMTTLLFWVKSECIRHCIKIANDGRFWNGKSLGFLNAKRCGVGSMISFRQFGTFFRNLFAKVPD